MALTVQEKFEKATKYVQGLPKDGPYQPKDDTKLKYYAYYKQATEGDAKGPQPSMFDFVGKAKRKAWEDVKGTSTEAAQEQYVVLLVTDLKQVQDKSEELKKLLEELEA